MHFSNFVEILNSKHHLVMLHELIVFFHIPGNKYIDGWSRWLSRKCLPI